VNFHNQTARRWLSGPGVRSFGTVRNVPVKKGTGVAIIVIIKHNYHIYLALASLLSAGALLSTLPSSCLAADVGLAWDPDSDPNIVGYRLHSGDQSGVYTQTVDVGNTAFVLVTNLVAGQPYYFAVTAYNNAAVESAPSNEVIYSVPASSPTPTPSATATPTTTPAPTATPTPTSTPTLTPTPTPTSTPSPAPTPESSPTPTPTPTPGPAVIVNPVPLSIFTSPAATFQWTAGSATAYALIVGSRSNSTDIYSSGIVQTLSATVNNIPTDGRTVFATLYSQVNNSWTLRKYTYYTSNGFATPTPTATPTPNSSPSPIPSIAPTPTPAPGAAQILSPAPGSSFTSSTVTFTWSSGNTSYDLFVGSSPHSADIYNSGLTHALSASVGNVPTDGRTIYVTLVSKGNGLWKANTYTYKSL
jgi:Fibronectin type III domain